MSNRRERRGGFGEGRRKKEEGRRKREEGRGKKEEGRSKREEVRGKREEETRNKEGYQLPTVNDRLSTYKQIGNSVCVPVVEGIAKEILNQNLLSNEQITPQRRTENYIQLALFN